MRTSATAIGVIKNTAAVVSVSCTCFMRLQVSLLIESFDTIVQPSVDAQRTDVGREREREKERERERERDSESQKGIGFAQTTRRGPRDWLADASFDP